MSSDVATTLNGKEQNDNQAKLTEHISHNGDVDAEDDNVFSNEVETFSLSGDDAELDIYTCPKCEEEYKQPRVLSCLHVFCENCLVPLVTDESIACPTCGTVSTNDTWWYTHRLTFNKLS